MKLKMNRFTISSSPLCQNLTSQHRCGTGHTVHLDLAPPRAPCRDQGAHCPGQKMAIECCCHVGVSTARAGTQKVQLCGRHSPNGCCNVGVDDRLLPSCVSTARARTRLLQPSLTQQMVRRGTKLQPAALRLGDRSQPSCVRTARARRRLLRHCSRHSRN